MKYLILIPVLALVACASQKVAETPAPVVTPVQVATVAKVPDFDVHMMSRSEVISAVSQCESNDMKPFIEYISQRTDFGSKVMVPVNVHCDPVRRK